MAADDLAAKLAEIQARDERVWHGRGNVDGLLAITEAKDDVPRLLAAVDAVLKLHRPYPLYGVLDSMAEDASCTCGHDPEARCHFESDDGEWLCRCKLERTACETCFSEDELGERLDWPCPEYQAITTALSGDTDD